MDPRLPLPDSTAEIDPFSNKAPVMSPHRSVVAAQAERDDTAESNRRRSPEARDADEPHVPTAISRSPGRSGDPDPKVADSESQAVPDDSPVEEARDGPDRRPSLSDEPQPSDERPPSRSEDDGWDCQWDQNSQAWYFVNRFTGKTQWENPRVPSANDAANVADTAPGTSQPPINKTPPAGGYNPVIHGDYDPNAWYAQVYNQENEAAATAATATALEPLSTYGVTVGFNSRSGQFQTDENGPDRHNDENKARRQMSAYFDVDAAANSHDGRSLRAERQNQRLSKSELKAYKEKRRAKKEVKRRAWLMD